MSDQRFILLQPSDDARPGWVPMPPPMTTDFAVLKLPASMVVQIGSPARHGSCATASEDLW